jgi:hypothetical protein
MTMAATHDDRVSPRRVIVMPGARMVRSPGSTAWHFPLFAAERSGSSRAGSVSGGAARMRAIEIEHRRMGERGAANALIVLVTGGREMDGASRAREAARQLVARYGLPAGAVRALESGSSTLGNAESVADHLVANRDRFGHVRTVEIVTNDYHMLRSWLMFSSAMRRHHADGTFAVSPADAGAIEGVLDAGMPGAAWSPASVAQCRRAAMAILEPYFSDLPVRFVPLVVEDVLESCGLAAARRYSRLLRTSRWVTDGLRLEYRGIIDLLKGTYRRR